MTNISRHLLIYITHWAQAIPSCLYHIAGLCMLTLFFPMSSHHFSWTANFTCTMFRSCWWGHVSLASNNYGTAWQSLCWWCFLSEHSFPARLPLQTTKGLNSEGSSYVQILFFFIHFSYCALCTVASFVVLDSLNVVSFNKYRFLLGKNS